MNKKFSQEFSTNSNSSAVNKSTAIPHNPSFFSGGPKVPFQLFEGTADDHKEPSSGTPSMCIFMKTVKEMKADYMPREDDAEIMPGATVPYPPEIASTYGALTSPLMTAEMRLKLLSLLDSCDAATIKAQRRMTAEMQLELLLDSCDAAALEVQRGMPARPPEKPSSIDKLCAPVDAAIRKLAHVAYQFNHQIKVDQAQYEAKGAPTEQELVDAYEEWQFKKRRELGEPVVLQDKRLCFEKFVLEAGYRPGPFPGLDFYTRNCKLVDPKAFAKWLNSTKAQRKERQGEYVGIFGCPTCELRMADMLWFFGLRFDIHGSEGYREYIKYMGQPPVLISFNSIYVQSVMNSGKPLPCMMKG